MPKAVDYDDAASDYDKRYVEQSYPGIEATLGQRCAPGQRVLEVGCGSGHWLGYLSQLGCRVTGLDPSTGMLTQARRHLGPNAALVRGTAEQLPFAPASFDHIVVVNAAHHFADLPRFVNEANRVLRPGGGIAIIGLDPSEGGDSWFVYDYFPGTLEMDRARYPGTRALRNTLQRAGFANCQARIAERIVNRQSAQDYLGLGRRMRSFTSQLLLLDEGAFERGVATIRAVSSSAEARGETLALAADLRLYVTTARREPQSS